MATREEILGTIRKALDHGRTNPPLPNPPVVWPVRGVSADETLKEFQKNLTAVAGESFLCRNRSDAAVKIADVLASLPVNPGVNGTGRNFEWGIRAGEITESLAESVEKIVADPFKAKGTELKKVFAPMDPEMTSPPLLETLSASLVSAEFLLADTGSAVIRSANAFDRLLCYLSPVCLIAAKKSTLREHLPHAWPEMVRRLEGKAEATGEFLLMTGPSRTADIEKILILGVHGPKKMSVFVIEDE